MESKQFNCPGCGSTELYLIGATIKGQQGVLYKGVLTVAQLSDLNPVVSEGLVICKICKQQNSTIEVNNFNEFENSKIRWEINSEGLKIPIICPVCRNTSDFYRHVLVSQRMVQNVYAGTEEALQPQVDVEPSSLVTAYECAIAGCTGYINLQNPLPYVKE